MKNNIEKNKIKLVGFLFILGIIIFSCNYLLFGQKPEVFTDIIAETLSALKVNKTIELKCFWIITFIGGIILLIHYIHCQIKSVKNEKKNVLNIINFSILTIVISSIVYYFFTSSISLPLVIILFLILTSNFLIPGKEDKILVACCFVYYTLYSFIILLNSYITELLIKDDMLLLTTFIIGIFLIRIEKKYNIIDKIILILQIFIPILLIDYLINRYTYQNQTMYLNLPMFFRIGMKLLILLFEIYNIVFIWKKLKNKNKNYKLNDLIPITSLIVLFIFNSIDVNTSLILPTDLHHSGENILSYQQIFALGQKAYTEYIPVSGLFAVISGFILELCGGKLIYYNVSVVIFQMLIGIVTIILANRFLKKSELLVFCLLFKLSAYNRVYMILISILVLMLPKLIENKNLWLKVWIVVCFLGGIYYPTYGVAVLAGTLPFGIVQFIGYIKSEEIRHDIRKISFYIKWLIVVIPILCCIPLLINILKHTLIYSSQTILADGNSVFGQELPNFLFHIFDNHKFVQKILFYSIRYMIPIGAVWTFEILLLNIFSKKLNKNNFIEILKSNKFLAISSGLIILLVSYSYTLVRADSNMLLARSSNLIAIICGMLLFIILINFFNKNVNSSVILGIFIGILLSLNISPLNGLDNKIFYSYNISDDFQLVEKSILPRLGEGFVTKGKLTTILNENYSLEEIESLYKNSQKLLNYDKNLNFVLYGCLGTYYLMDLPSIGQPSIHAIKGLEASNELIEYIVKYKPVVGRNIVNTEQNYYIYHWLITNKDYKYSDEYQAFLPSELYKKIYGDKEINNDVGPQLTKIDFNRATASFGESYESLKNIFNEVDLKYDTKCDYNIDNEFECNYKFKNKLYGDNADFIYLDIYTNRDEYSERSISNILNIDLTNADVLVKISWDNNENYVTSQMFKGKLLFEIGANSKWLLENHDSIKITITGINSNYDLKINNIKFLKLDVNRKS